MDRETREARARTFGVNPRDYDAVRPGYPDELFSDLLAFAELGCGAQVLEIGCGTGQATRFLADLDVDLTCLEPGGPLCALARQNLAEHANVRCLNVEFEAFASPRDAFELIFAATSFHWIDPDVRMPKCAQLLAPGGTLAVFSSTHPAPYTGFFSEVQELYDRHVPEWTRPRKPESSRHVNVTQEPDEGVLNDENFSDAVYRSYDWSCDFSADDYVRLLRTFSDHIRLGEERLAGLAEDIRKFIEERYGGYVTRPYRSVLHMAKLR